MWERETERAAALEAKKHRAKDCKRLVIYRQTLPNPRSSKISTLITFLSVLITDFEAS